MIENSGKATLEEQVMSKGKQLAEGFWKPLVEDLADSHGPQTQQITACMLENQKKHFESPQIVEMVKTGNVGNFLKFAFPMVRAVFPNLVAMDLVSVQPMQGPVSLVFYLDFLYGSSKGDVTKGDRLYRAGFPEQTADDPSQYDGHDSNFLYSSETSPLEDTGLDTNGSGAATVTNYQSKYLPIRSASVELWIGTSRANAVKAATSNADGSWSDIAGGATITGGAGSINYTTGSISVGIAGATANANVYFTYRYVSEGTNQVMEIDLMLQSSSVEATPRKLKANWSVEAANDLKSLHDLDVEAELTAVLADQIRFEIDREIIEDLKTLSKSNGIAQNVWSKSTGGAYSYYEKKMEFYDQLIERSNQIFKMTRRASGNFVVMGIDVANVVEALPGFQPANVTGNGVVKTGTLRGQWDVYKDPYFTSDEYIVGYKGNSFLDAGYVFAPYIPLFTTPTYMFADMVGTKGMMTRYGKKTINNRFYVSGKVTN